MTLVSAGALLKGISAGAAPGGAVDGYCSPYPKAHTCTWSLVHSGAAAVVALDVA